MATISVPLDGDKTLTVKYVKAVFGAPALISPGQPINEATVGNAGVRTTTPTLSWQAVSGAVSYQLQVDNNFNTFASPEVDITTTGTSYTVPFGRLGYDDSYGWRVRAVKADGTLSDWATPLLFVTVGAHPWVEGVHYAVGQSPDGSWFTTCLLGDAGRSSEPTKEAALNDMLYHLDTRHSFP